MCLTTVAHNSKLYQKIAHIYVQSVVISKMDGNYKELTLFF